MALESLIGAGIGAVGSLFGGKKKSSYDPYGSFTPEQRALAQTLGSRLNSSIGQGPQQYGGQLNASITPEELDVIRQFNQGASTSFGSLGRLADYNDAAFNDQFAQEIVNPTFNQFRQYTQPILEESLPSFSTARANVVARALNDTQDQLLQQRFAAREAAKNRSITASGALQDLGASALNINAVPRVIQQAGLDKAYSEFVRSNEQYGQDINQALNYLHIPSGVERAPNTSTLERLIAGAGAGAQIGSATGNVQSSNNQNRQLKQLIDLLQNQTSPVGYDSAGNPYSPIGGF